MSASVSPAPAQPFDIPFVDRPWRTGQDGGVPHNGVEPLVTGIGSEGLDQHAFDYLVRHPVNAKLVAGSRRHNGAFRLMDVRYTTMCFSASVRLDANPSTTLYRRNRSYTSSG